ncbi:MAG: DJ-1/PfpI family protein [Bacillota bacterium]
MYKTRNVGILVFNDVEVMDFCGPFEVFSVANRTSSNQPFQVFTIAEKEGPVCARNKLSINPQYTIHNCLKLDILIVPGGQGTRNEMNNEIILNWIKSINPDLELLLTVCTGALIIAKCGLLDGLTATTHHLSLDLLKEIALDTNIVSGERYIDNGKIILSGGISAGIDMSLYVVEKLLGKESAAKTTDIMEYGW